MIGSVTEFVEQQRELLARRQAAQARSSAAPYPPAQQPSPEGITKAGKLPPVPRPTEAHIRWADGVLADDWQAAPNDRLAAQRVRVAADLSQDHADSDPDTAPPGARDIAAAVEARERAEDEAARARENRRRGRVGEPADVSAEQAATSAHAAARAGESRKNFADRGATPGPDEPLEPGKPEPQDYRRPYVEAGHAARSPMAEPPRTSPLPPMGRGILTPIELSGVPVVAGHEGAFTSAARVHQARVNVRPPIPGREAR
jgi:hypothetical protein